MIAQLSKSYITARPGKAFQRLLSYFLYEGRPATTRGRWFNPVTFKFLRYATSHSMNPGAEAPVFITGTGRSGSTILGLVLSMHKDVGFLNEPKALWHSVYPHGDLTGSYTSDDAFFSLDHDDISGDIDRKVKSIYSSFMSYTGSSVIVDKFPEMIFRIEFLKAMFRNPKFLFLYRNPWDTIVSTAEWSKDNTQVENNRVEDWWGVDNRKWQLLVEQVVPYDPYIGQYKDEILCLDSQFDKAAVEWIVTMNRGLKAIEDHPDLFFPVSYEELVASPEEKLDRLFRFLDLPSDAKAMEYAKKVLRPRPSRGKIELHPMLMEALSETSIKLGYGSQFPEMSVTE